MWWDQWSVHVAAGLVWISVGALVILSMDGVRLDKRLHYLILFVCGPIAWYFWFAWHIDYEAEDWDDW